MRISDWSSGVCSSDLWRGERLRELVDEWSAAWVAMAGVPGFFRPRMMPPLLAMPGTSEALSHYDTGPLRQTLTSLVDFDLLNEGPVDRKSTRLNSSH